MGIIIETECDNWFLKLLEIGWLIAIGKNVYTLATSPPEEKGINTIGTLASAGIGYAIIKVIDGPICK